MLSWARQASRGRRRGPDFRPDYGDRRLARIAGRLASSPLADRLAHATGRDGAAASSLALAAPEAIAARVVGHFGATVTPRLLVGALGVLQHGAFERGTADARVARWIDAAVRETLEAIDAGLPVYGERAAPLRPGFPWQGDAAGASADVLYRVRPHRFGFVPRYALAVCAGAVPPDALGALLHDWMRFAQLDPALPFVSNLVVAQRLFACTWAFAYLQAPAQTPAVAACRFALLRIAFEDARYLLPRLGESYPNNHLLVDRFADWFVASLYPELRVPDFDIAAIEAAWVAELDRQTFADGGSFEHSVHYHGLACELAVAYMLLKKSAGSPLPPEARDRIGRMLRFQADLGGPDGIVPHIGDGTEDAVFALEAGNDAGAPALREIHRALFDSALPPARSDHRSLERAFWLLDGNLPEVDATAEARRFVEYPDSGLAVFFDDGESTRCTFRTGAIAGEKCMPGHMHADFLSVTLTWRGTPVLVDGGTFTYRFGMQRRAGADVNWREYFAGPRAHNGFLVDGADPVGTIRGDFRTAGPGSVIRHVARGSGGGVSFLEALMEAANGYPSLRRGVIHLQGWGFVIYNLLAGADAGREVATAFQFDPAYELAFAGAHRAVARRERAALTLAWSTGLVSPRIARGADDPAQGWVSTAYGELSAAPQLMMSLGRDRDLSALAVLPGCDDESIEIECEPLSGAARGFRIRSAGATDHVVLNLEPDPSPIGFAGMTIRARLAWVRLSDGAQPTLRWLDGVSCELGDGRSVQPCNGQQEDGGSASAQDRGECAASPLLQ